MIGKTTKEERLRKLKGVRPDPRPSPGESRPTLKTADCSTDTDHELGEDKVITARRGVPKPGGWDAWVVTVLAKHGPLSLPDVKATVWESMPLWLWQRMTAAEVEECLCRLISHGLAEWTPAGYTCDRDRWRKHMGIKS